MTDGYGRVDYAYNTMSQMTSETRTLTGVGVFTLGYSYNFAGQLTRITNPWNYTDDYSFDQMGRMATLSSNYGSASYISGVQYRAFGAPKQISYGDTHSLTVNYDNRLRLTRWDVAGVLGSDYEYRWEDTFRPTFAHSRTDATLDRWMAYDQVGRLAVTRTGSEARAAYAIEPFNGQYDGPYSQGFGYDVWGNMVHREGWGGWNPSYDATFNNKNQMITNPGLGTAMQYDAAGNMTFDGAQSFTYDATGAQVQAPYYSKWQGHDGDGLRIRDTQGSSTTYYLRSSVLGGKVIAEINPSGNWLRGYVYAGEQLVAVQSGGNYFVHQDPITKSQRITNAAGVVTEAIELDPFGGETSRNTNQNIQHHRYTTWERDWTGDESLFRRYHGWWSRFAHPDPTDESYELADPQSLNRYSYVKNDPVNFTDPSGLLPMMCGLFTVGWDGGPLFGFVCFGDYVPFGGYNDDRPRGGPGTSDSKPSAQKPDPKSACARFVDSLVGRLAANYNKFMPPVTLAPFGDLVAAATGGPIVAQAVKDVDERGNPFAKYKYPISGFRENLTNNNQLADVYHHILFVAGNVMLGEPGQAANAAFIAVDAYQAYIRGRKESETELRDGRAGQRVGNAMLKAAHNGRFDALRNQLMGILCNH